MKLKEHNRSCFKVLSGSNNHPKNSRYLQYCNSSMCWRGGEGSSAKLYRKWAALNSCSAICAALLLGDFGWMESSFPSYQNNESHTFPIPTQIAIEYVKISLFSSFFYHAIILWMLNSTYELIQFIKLSPN